MANGRIPNAVPFGDDEQDAILAEAMSGSEFSFTAFQEAEEREQAMRLNEALQAQEENQSIHPKNPFLQPAAGATSSAASTNPTTASQI